MNIDINKVKNVTLYTGDNGSNHCTCNCPCCSQKRRDKRYQGNLNQAYIMFEKLVNLKQLYVLGNPDPTVDTVFCNNVMLEAVKRNIHVCTSTSGIGGEETLKKLLNGTPTKMVDYISFSFDGTTENEMSFAKGVKYPMQSALQGLEWAISNGYIVKVQPTLWSWNYKKAGEIISFFYKRGVKWFTFHIGSLESNVELPTHRHLSLRQIEDVHSQIKKAVSQYPDVKVRCPTVYSELGENEPDKWYCMYPEKAKELLLIFTANGILATHTPLACWYNKNLTFMLDRNIMQMQDIPALSKNLVCPFSEALSNCDNTICRYISKRWNY